MFNKYIIWIVLFNVLEVQAITTCKRELKTESAGSSIAKFSIGLTLNYFNQPQFDNSATNDYSDQFTCGNHCIDVRIYEAENQFQCSTANPNCNINLF